MLEFIKTYFYDINWKTEILYFEWICHTAGAFKSTEKLKREGGGGVKMPPFPLIFILNKH